MAEKERIREIDRDAECSDGQTTAIAAMAHLISG